MKKNRMMRVASALLVAVLLTTCGISGTFAKYVSSAETNDTARVAKWGWGETSISIDLFDGNYDDTVVSSDGANVIAPGTKKTSELKWTPATTFQPEVDYTLSFAVTGTIPEDVEAQLSWTLTMDGEKTEYDTFEKLQAALNAKTYDGEAAQAAPTVNISIGWTWAYFDNDDTADNALGNAAIPANCNIKVTMTATQDD